jgi:lipopolysaccharide heptosyltransferase I
MRKILIVKPSSLGDIVHSLPFLNVMRTCFPDAQIHWVVAKGFEGLLEGHPMIDRLLVINKDAWKKISCARDTINEIRELFRALKRERYDLVIDLQGLLRSGIISKATGAPLRIGFHEAREGSRVFYTHKVVGGKDIHAVERYLRIAEFLGDKVSDISFPLPPAESLSPLNIQHPTFKIDEPYVVLVPGARWKTKRWPPEKFGRLSSMLPVQSVIAGGKSDTDIAEEIVSLSGGKAMSLAGKTDLKDLGEIMRNARFVVSNDSGPMHIAAALGIPVFAVFGPTDPKRTGPYGKGHSIIKADVSCAPCFKRTCDDMKCMKNVSAEKVFEIINENINPENRPLRDPPPRQ